MVLTTYERSVVTELLSGVDPDELIQLAKTVSQKFIDVKNSERALDVILLHSPSVKSILSRKKISKQLVFNYLHYKQVPIEPHLSKDELIQKLLNHWEEKALTWSTETPTIENRQIHSLEPNPPMNHPEHPSLAPQSHVVPQSHVAPQSHVVPQSRLHTSNHSSQEVILQSQEIQSQNSQEIHLPNPDSRLIVSNINIEELGSEFIKWFNSKFNACNASTGYAFDSTMFFSNATAEFRIVRNVNGHDTVENSSVVENNALIGQAFSELQRVYNLYINMNLDSLKVTKNSYGNILIGCQGSLHSASQLVGVYEQLFQLFHDPLCNLSDKPVWKVQKLGLNCRFASSRGIEPSSSRAEIEYNTSCGQLDIVRHS